MGPFSSNMTAPAHKARSIKTRMTDSGVDELDWPAQSPDLNPIEHLWDELERRLRARPSRPTSVCDLTNALLEEWSKIPINTLLNHVDSLPRRVEAVIVIKVRKRGNKKVLNVLSSEQLVPNDGPTECTKPGLSRVKQQSVEETAGAKDFGIKNEPADIPIDVEKVFIKPEEEDYPCTIVTVRIGENGTVEETGESVFSLDPQIQSKNCGQKDDYSNNSKTPVSHFPAKAKHQRKLVQGPHKFTSDDHKRKLMGKLLLKPRDEETTGEGSGLMSS
ncbi:hypothetical protein WMY93_020269 [Mugilogobius chulae]|uniref:Tc1-like transposase DDE domain-containing protein n=1 Tax=Mugilogobius chulae TaxID=88201 RepID=A0AAW0NGU6_9GOBI